MADYSDNIMQTSCQSINDIIDWCCQLVPEQYKHFPWKHPELGHGQNLLKSDDALNCYMAAYGEMHMYKCRAAMMTFPFDNLNGSIEIVDWGCGQGIGSATILDVLNQHGLIQWVKRVTLIEPSAQALKRAESNMMKITASNVIIDAINKYLPSSDDNIKDTIDSVGYSYTNVIHIFSNILDVTSIDLAAVAKMVASSKGNHYILCIGPMNSTAYRIAQFCSIFGNQQYFSQIDSVSYGRIRRTGYPYTCLTRCFCYDGSSLDYSKMSLYKDPGLKLLDEYDLELQIQNNVLSPQKARVAYRLQNILAIDDIMYIGPVVNEVKVDFIIVRPNKGILLINVFENNLNNCELSNDSKEITIIDKGDNDIGTYQSPIDLINLCQKSIKDGIEELLMSTIESSRNFGLIKKAVIFTENTMDCIKSFFNIDSDCQNFTYLFGNSFIKNKSVSQTLYNKLGFTTNTNAFDDVVIRKLASIISPSWHSYQEGIIGIEPKGVQKELSKSRNVQQKISGVAGAGKTHVLALRAINAIKRTSGNVLILTYTKTLPNYLRFRLSQIREDFSWDKVDIFFYHHFFRIRASECQLHVDFGSYDDIDFFENAQNHKTYSAIFVDEVQNYTTEWLKILTQYFLEPDGEFVVFGDPKQNVYHRPIDSNKDIRLGVIGGVWNKELNQGRRFNNPRLVSLATAFQTKYLSSLTVDNIITNKPFDNTLDFQSLAYYDIRSNNDVNNIVSQIIGIIDESKADAKDFVVLAHSSKLLRSIDYNYRNRTGNNTEVTFVSTEQYEWLKKIHNVTDDNTANWRFKQDFESLEGTRKRLFTTDKRFIKFSTILSFQGWESPSIIVILEDDCLGNSSNYSLTPEVVYTAITRARESLFIINVGNNTYDKFFKSQLT